jgi:hypothetical protein
MPTPDAPVPHRPATPPRPSLPAFGGGSIADVVPALLDPGGRGGEAAAAWLPEAVRHADQIVLLVLDGLGWLQLRDRAHLAPTLASATGIERPLTSVAPTTTATALTSITTGRPPADHGILGYRLDVGGEILNILHWTIGDHPARDARRTFPARDLQPHPSFPGSAGRVPVVSKAEFGGTGFTAAHLGNSPLHGYRVQSSLPLEIGELLAAGEPFVYAYYDGIDRIAHADGLGERYEAELRTTDRLVGDVVAALPPGAVLVVTADHGEVQVGADVELLGAEAMAMVDFLSGEGRFRWLHAREGAVADLVDAMSERYGPTTWVLERDELVDAGWFGGPLPDVLRRRLGDVALVPFAPIAFLDPADTGESRLQARHGSLTDEELLVPLLAFEGGSR